MDLSHRECRRGQSGPFHIRNAGDMLIVERGSVMPTVDTTSQTTQVLSRDERIRLRAEEFYKRRGNRPGSAMDDWLLAEKEIRAEEEQAIDEASEESFPASDPPAR